MKTSIKLTFLCALVFLGVSSLPPYCTAQSAKQPITLDWISFVSVADPQVNNIKNAFFDKVNEKAKGELVLRFRGGPEAMNAIDQPKAVQQGSIDIAYTIVGFYEALVRGVSAAMLSQISLDEERRPNGAYDFLSNMHTKNGLYYLGRGAPSTENFFYLMLRKKVTNRDDFKGLKLGTATAARAAVAAWGATPVTVGIPDYYPAMERGVVDGIASGSVRHWASVGIAEVTKYCVDHPYYAGTQSIIMNLKKWNSLPQNLQKLLNESIIAAEKEIVVIQDADYAKAKDEIRQEGVEIYKFSPEVAKWFLDTAYNGAWDYQQKRFPQVTPRLRELLSKP